LARYLARSHNTYEASQKLGSSVVTLARLTIVMLAVTLAVEVATGFSLILLLLYMDSDD
jgi:hypothetical protein